MIHSKHIYRILRRRSHLKKDYEERTFDSSAIGDLAFLLLIFFIVTSSFILRQGLKLSLPSKSAGTVQVEAERIFEVYPRNNGFVVDQRLVSRVELKDMLLKHKKLHANPQKKPHKNPVVLIFMENGVKYKRLIDTLSLIKQEVGIKTVSIKNSNGGKENV